MSHPSSVSSLTSASAAKLKGVFNKVGKAGSAVHAMATGTNQTPPPPPNVGLQHGQVLNCHKAMHDYVTRMVATVKGMKALLLDRETTSMVGLVHSQSDMIAREVFLVESIHVIADAMVEEAQEEAALRRSMAGRKGAIMRSDNVGINEQSMQHLQAVTFVQPNAVTLEKLAVLLKSPRYKEYHIFFTNILPGGFLEALADLDVYSRITQVHEFYADYFAVSPSLFHLNADATRAQRAIQENKQFSSAASWQYDRDFQGLLSVMLSLKKRCDIRYMGGSDLCKRLALDLSATMKEEQELFTFQGEPTLLLLLDRRDDAVTPLLTQWTYQAMVHELLGINMNRINLAERTPAEMAAAEAAAAAGGPKSAEQKQQDALRDVVLSSEQDEFFRSSMLVNFGELGIRIKKLVADFQALTRTQTKLESIDDMQRFVDNYPQFKLQSGTVSKHVSVMGEISKVVNARSLLTVSALEQEIVCGTEHQIAYDKLHKLMEDREVQFPDKLKCTILYALRYESLPNNLPVLRGLLRAHARMSNYSEAVLEVIDRVLAFSGSHPRSWPLFRDSDALSIKNVVKSIQTNVKGIDNIYTQHKPLVHEILNHLFAGELKTQHFPFADSGSSRTIYRRVIVFMVGGATYEEYASIESLMASPRWKGNFTTLLGGSCIHNSESFLRDLCGGLEGYKLDARAQREEYANQQPQGYPQPAGYTQPSGYAPQQQQQQPQQQQRYYPQQQQQPPFQQQQPPQQQSQQSGGLQPFQMSYSQSSAPQLYQPSGYPPAQQLPLPAARASSQPTSPQYILTSHSTQQYNPQPQSTMPPPQMPQAQTQSQMQSMRTPSPFGQQQGSASSSASPSPQPAQQQQRRPPPAASANPNDVRLQVDGPGSGPRAAAPAQSQSFGPGQQQRGGGPPRQPAPMQDAFRTQQRPQQPSQQQQQGAGGGQRPPQRGPGPQQQGVRPPPRNL